MSDFDAQGYFDRRQTAITEATSKIAALEAAKAQKLQSMQAFKQARDASTAANQNAWANQLGLDPDGTLGTLVNIGAAGVDGLGRIFKNAATAIPTIDVAIRNYGIPDNVRAAKSRMDDGMATPEDLDLLSQREPGNKNTFFERLQQVEAKSRRVSALNQVLDTSSIVDKTNQDALVTELKDVAKPGLDQMKAGWEAGFGEGKADMVSGLAKALMTIPGAALNNPAAAFEFVASNVPQLVAAGVGGAAGMAATNVPYAIDAYREGIAEYQKKNGKMPDQAWMEVNAAKAASLLVAETVGDKLTLGVGKSVGSITDPAKAALDKGIEQISREAFKNSIKGVGALVAPVARTAAAIGQGGLGEFATEAYQTAVEESIKGNETTAEEAFVGGAVGAISGGTSSGGIAVAKEGVDGVVAGLTKALTPSAKKDAPLTDLLPQSQELEALFVANQDEKTDAPTRAANLVKAQELVASLEAAVTQTQQTSAVGSTIAPADLAEMKTTLDVVKKVLEQTDPADTARVAQLTQAVTEMESTIAAADKKASVSQKASLSGRERELNKARLVLEAMTEQAELTAPNAGTTEEVDEADQTPTTKAVRRIVLSMAAVDAMSPEEATQMADDTTLELSDKQRNYLRVFSEARVAENSMKNTSTVLDEILTDKGGKNLSLVDYREKIALALNNGNKARAGQLVGMLASFARDHGNKAKLAQELYAKALKGGAPTQMVSDGQGNWSVPAQPLSPEQLRINGGLTISNGSGKLVQDIGKGSQALALNLAQQEAAYDMTFGSKPTDVKVEPITSAKQIIEKAKAAIEPKKEEEQKAEPNSTKEDTGSLLDTVHQIGGKDPHTITFTRRDSDGRLTRVIEYPDGEKTTNFLVTDKNGDEHWVSVEGYGKGEFYPVKTTPTSAENTIANELQIKQKPKEESTSEVPTSTVVPAGTSVPGGTVEAADVTQLNEALQPYAQDVRIVESQSLDEYGLPRASAGAVYKGRGFIVLAQRALTTVWKNFTQAESVHIRMAHEAAHLQDYRHGFAYSEQLLADGWLAYFKEAFESMEPQDEMYPWLEMLFDTKRYGDSGEVTQSRELHAQLGALHSFNPGLLKSRFPEAYQLTEDTYANERDSVQDGDGTQEWGDSGEGVLGESRQSSSSTEAQQDSREPASNQGTEESAKTASTAEAQTGITEEDVAEAEKAVPDTEGEVDEGLEPGYLEQFSKENFELEKAKTSYFDLNLLTRFFKQTAGKAGSIQFRPLAAVKDFISQWDKGNLTDEIPDSPALDHFRETALGWFPLIKANLYGKTPQKFAHTDVMQFFLTQLADEKTTVADMPENVKAAIALVAYQYVHELAGGTGHNTVDALNKLLKKPKGNRAFSELQEQLFTAGTLEHTVHNSLGQSIMAALGISPKKDAPQDIVARMESALGAHAVKLLIDDGYLTVKTFNGTEWAEMTDNGKVNARELVHFVHLTRDKNNKPLAKAEAIYQAQKGTQDILGKTFSVLSRNPEPSFEPVPYVQTAPNNTKQSVPAKLAKILAKQNASANYLKQASWNVLKLLDPQNVHLMMGVKEISQDTVHVNREKSVMAKNAGLIKEYEVLMDYVNNVLAQGANGLAQAMYFSHVAWKNQRVGQEGVINAQTSKLHRFMLTRDSWKSKVHINVVEEMDSFQLRVAEGLGVKTENFLLDPALKQFQSKVAIPEIQAAVTALRKVLADNKLEGLSAEDQAAIVAGVDKGGEKMHSFDALMALAQYEEAVANGQDSFETDLAGEIDGKTNGPMLSFLFLGAALNAKKLFQRINKGGFYSTTDTADQYSTWRSQAGNRDLYEDTSVSMVARVREHIMSLPENKSQAYGPIFHFIGDILADSAEAVKAGRELVKTPITALMFGSSIKSSIDSMAQSFLDSVYKNIETAAGDALNSEKADGVPARTLEIIQNLNRLVPSLEIPENWSITDLMNLKFTLREQEALMKVFTQSMGKPISSTLEYEFGEYIAIRDSINKTGEVAFTLYQSAYQGIRKAFIDRLIKEGKIEVSEKGDKVYDLSKEQEAELRKELVKAIPTVTTAFAKGDKDPKSGLLVGKETNRQNNDPTYRGSVKFGMRYKVLPSSGGKADPKKPVMSTTTIGTGPSMSGPGVGTVSSQIHSSDSAISHAAAFMGEVLNIHDAHVTGLKTFRDTGANLNKATWDTLLDYSPTREILNTLERTIEGIAELLQNPEFSEEIKASLDAGLRAYAEAKSSWENVVDPYTVLADALREAAQTAHDSDQVRLSTLAEMAVVDQYPTLGGQYKTTDQDRAKAASRRDGLKGKTTASAEAQSAVLAIEDALAGVAEAGTNPPIAVGDETNVDDEGTGNDLPSTVEPTSTPAKSPWGTIGDPTLKTEDDIAGLFKDKQSMSGKELANALIDALTARPDGANKKFKIFLLKAIVKVLPANLKVQLVTPTTKDSEVTRKPEKPAHAWMDTDPANPVLYFTSKHFVNSGMTAETMIHELVHAALSDAIYQVEAGKGTADAVALVYELNRLLKASRAYVERNKDELKRLYKEDFSRALINIDELVAWGMSNELFQQEVLNKIRMKDKNSNRLVDAAKLFYGILSNFFFSGASPTAGKVMATGMEVLMTNVSGLLAVAGTTTGSNEAKRNVLSMAVQAASTYNTKDIFNALGNSQLSPVSAQFAVHLEELLDGIVFRLHGVFGSFKESLMKDQVISPEDVFQKAIATGKAPFASQLLVSGFRISEQEAFVMEQVEVTVQAALDGNEEGSMAYAARGLSKLYEEARRSLTVKDFLEGDKNNPTQVEQARAQALYDFVFKVEAGNGARSNYLARFAALGMAHEGFNTLLKSKTLDKPAAPKALTTMSIANRLGAIVQTIMQWFSEKMTRTYKGQPANSKLSTLVKQLVDIEGKRRNMLKHPAGSTLMDQLTETGSKAAEAVNSKIVDFANSSFVQNSPSQLFKAGVTVGRFIAEHRTDQLLEAMAKMRDRYSSGQLGLTFGTIKDALGAPELFQKILRATKSLEKDRKHISTQTSKLMLQGFVNQGRDLEDKDKKALSNVILRTGSHVLLDHYSDSELHKLLSDPAERSKAIAAWEAKLSVYPKDVQKYYVNQSRALGHHLVVGEARGPNMMMNAGNIASLHDTGRQGKVTPEQVTQATKDLDVLITLYALSYSSQPQLNLVAKLLATEMARTDKQGNGLLNVMYGHKALENEARERLFSGTETMLAKGYTSEIFNPYTEIVAAEESDPAAQVLVDQGYTAGPPLKKDPSDPDKGVNRLYIRRGGGLSQHVTGIYSYTGKEASGSTTHNGNTSMHNKAGRLNTIHLNTMKARKAKEVDQLFTQDYDPLLDTHKHVAPILDPSGKVVNYRYLMTSDVKDTLLERDNRFEVVMGAMAASSFDKQTATEQNTVATKALHDLYKVDYAKNPEAYLEVGPNSKDPELREIWRLLPYETQQAIRREWGSEKMMVRNDLLDLSFGYRKLSLAKLWDKPESARNQLEFAVTWFAEHVVEQAARVRGATPAEAKQRAKRTQHIVQKSERMWMDLMKEVKDIIVVKTGTVMLGNILSNVSLLALNGVSLAEMSKHHQTATLGAKAWQNDSTELFKLQQDLKSGYSTQTVAELERQIRVVEDRMSRNPVKTLIDAGLMPSIVEDVSIEDSPYTYKAQLARKVDNFTANINPTVLGVAKQVYMTKDSVPYKTLSEITQLSDFVARFTLYTHLTTRKNNPMSSEAAIQKASDSFVNYDIPMHRKLQYLDDAGLLMFMKYLVRIQRVIGSLIKDNPTRVIGAVLLNQVVDLPNLVLESSVLARSWGNPLSAGAVQLPLLFDDLATVKAGVSLFK